MGDDESKDEAAERLLAQQEARSEPARRFPASLARAALEQNGMEVLRRAGLKQPVGFDGAGMWKAIQNAFYEAEVRHDAATVPSKADIKAATALMKAARDMSAASAYLWKHHRTAGMAVAARLGLPYQSRLPPAAAAAAEFFWYSPDSSLALEKAAKQAAADLADHHQIGAASPRNGKEPAAAWLITDALPAIALQFMKIKPTFGEDTATARRSNCVRFIQAAYSVMKQIPPTDVMIVQTRKRANTARRAKAGPAESTPANRTRAKKSNRVSK